jgi:hypothetical protein
MTAEVKAVDLSGLVLARKELLAAGYQAGDAPDRILSALILSARAVVAAEQQARARGFCGDPYVHDCGRVGCPTSDSFDGQLAQARAVFEGSQDGLDAIEYLDALTRASGFSVITQGRATAVRLELTNYGVGPAASVHIRRRDNLAGLVAGVYELEVVRVIGVPVAPAGIDSEGGSHD